MHLDRGDRVAKVPGATTSYRREIKWEWKRKSGVCIVIENGYSVFYSYVLNSIRALILRRYPTLCKWCARLFSLLLNK